MRLLLVNPNTTAAVTGTVMRAAAAVAAAHTELVGVTGGFGPAVIGSRAEEALAQHSVLQLVADHAAGCDAVVLAVSLDTGLWACRELLDIPVIGMTEAGLLMGCTVGTRLGIVTFEHRMQAFYRDLAERHGMASRLAGVATLPVPAERIFDDPQGVHGEIVAACNRLVEQHDAQAVLLAGAVLAGLQPALQADVPVPLLDGVACAVLLAEARATLRLPKARAGSLSPTGGRRVHGVSPALTRLFAGQP
ncbi:hydantoin racemase [Verticiella sediminum]|uniref:Hydantoin racemase n=1 Tax=Verticiella sediminum TaxID=1247510 RepID=A0A556ARH1_9BURK|nr:aspartate/glutamate racemase family protein [Verticiella sediminum]TSH95551.1 hydantoin racemase [Verticiella sediminum]